MRGMLFDMDGVLYNSEEPVPGAAAALAWVRNNGIPHLFVTNTTSRSRSVLAGKLARFGIEAGETQILTPCEVAARWLRTRPADTIALFVRPGARSAFEGLNLLPDNAEAGASW